MGASASFVDTSFVFAVDDDLVDLVNLGLDVIHRVNLRVIDTLL